MNWKDVGYDNLEKLFKSGKSLQDIATMYNCPLHSVKNIRARVWPVGQVQKKWTTGEVNYLKQNINQPSVRLAAHMGRTILSIRNKKKQLRNE